MSIRRLAALSTLLVLSCWLAVPSFADSQARIVRLSQVDGDVQIDRNTGQGYEKAFINLPITQGAKLRTGQGARAEIEFEDGSTPASYSRLGRRVPRTGAARLRRPDVERGTSAGNRLSEFQRRQSRKSSFLLSDRKGCALTKPSHLRHRTERRQRHRGRVQWRRSKSTALQAR